MGLLSEIKKLFIFQLLIVYSFVVSGFIVCFMMLLVTIFLQPFNLTLSRKIKVYLAYSHWTHFTAVGQWWSGTEVYLKMPEEDIKYVGKEHCLVMMNHKYDIDWLMTWILAERFTMLGNTKIYGKEMLKYVPFIGWIWYLTESIFLKRDWDQDKRIIDNDIQKLVEYPENYPVTLLLFPEGTRFTEAKQKASLEISRKKGYPEMKHVLLPRTKGFVLSMHGLRGKFPVIYDLTIGFRTPGPEPTLMNVLSGQKLTAEIYGKRIKILDVPIDTDEECGDWLRDLFKQKDDLYDEFLEKGHFPGKAHVIPKRKNDLVMWLFWMVVTCIPLFSYLGRIFLSGTLYQQLVFLAIAGLVTFIVRWMIGVTEIKKGSEYGKAASANGSKKTE